MNTPRRVEHQQTDRGTIPVYATGVVEQPWASYSDSDHAVWGELFRRQHKVLADRVCEEFLAGQDALQITADAIPRFTDLNRILRAATGWELVGVEGLLPEYAFFEHLANRRFPITWWIRTSEQVDYIAEPDLFHDLFGHVPLLMNPVFADYMEAYGRGAMKAHGIGEQALLNLTRLYWYTVEFGLIRTGSGLRIYGAGIISSSGESVYCLESAAPNRIGFDLQRIMCAQYHIDTFQQTYFIIDSFEQLFEATRPDLAPVYQHLAGHQSIPAREVLGTDSVIHRGSREGFANDA